MTDVNFNVLILTRIIAAISFGFVMGICIQRKLLRTCILVCLFFCVFTLLSIYVLPLFVDHTHFHNFTSIAAQIISIIGVIGIVFLRFYEVLYVQRFITTFILCITAAIGMACGAGGITMGLALTLLSIGLLGLCVLNK